MDNTPTILSERLRLRRFEERDLSALYELFHDEEVNTFLPRFPIHTMAEAQQIYEENFAAKYTRERGYYYAICLRESDIAIGYVVASLHDAHDFGYALRKEYWHQGIVSEAGAMVVAQLKQDGVPFITATHDILNPRSGEVMKRIGMHYAYTYVEEHWMPKDRCAVFRMYQLNLDGNDTRIYRRYWDEYETHFIEQEEVIR